MALFAVSATTFAILDYSDEADATSSGDDGNIHWYISKDTLTLSKMADQSSGSMKNYDLHSRPAWEKGVGWIAVTKVVIQEDVTSIGFYAFYGFAALKSVTIGNSVTSIGYYAFYRCTSLESMAIGNSVDYIGEHAFEGCTSLTSITVPSSTRFVGQYAFSKCTSLTSATVLNQDTSIDGYVFFECTSLTTVVFENSNNAYGVFITIHGNAFYNCVNLTKIVIKSPATVFGKNSIVFNDPDKHTIYVVAPQGYAISDDALSGNIEIIYGEPPSHSEINVGTVLIVAIVCILAIIGCVFYLKKHKC